MHFLLLNLVRESRLEVLFPWQHGRHCKSTKYIHCHYKLVENETLLWSQDEWISLTNSPLSPLSRHFAFQLRGSWVDLREFLITNFSVRLDVLERSSNSIALGWRSVDRGVQRRHLSVQGDQWGASAGKSKDEPQQPPSALGIKFTQCY